MSILSNTVRSQVPIFLFYIFHHYQRFRCKVEQRMLFYSRYKLIFILANASATILLVNLYGLEGSLIGVGLSVVLALSFLAYCGEMTPPRFSSLRNGCRLTIDGFPQFINGYIWFLLRALDRFVILTMLGSGMAGYFGLAGFFTSLLSEIPLALTHVLFPRTIYAYHLSGNRKAIRSFFNQPLYFVSRFISVLIGFLFVNIHWMLNWFLPKYLQAEMVLKILLFSMFFSSL
ncbi:hypothetical protein C2W62_16840 [Candidatus Entotheonella serta]|nr:hypothetical protein C2W62_16840 [Candidatus Entotheonella serta]